ncbi:trichohyalin-like [Cyclopterus lumpus]|uniref:trichohyalin-like n=1 Tax=Cyclopterus lumpus TaxID=8103 RepID=UPI001486C52B|nr:trichohyalin-like [Cyclopterus lumpus]
MDICEYLDHVLQQDQKEQELVQQLVQQLERLQQEAQQAEEALRLQHSLQLMELQDRVPSKAKSEEQQQELKELQSVLESEEEQLLRQKEEHKSVLGAMTRAAQDLEKTRSREPNYIETETETQDLVRVQQAWHGELREVVESLLDQNEVLWRQKGALQDQKALLLKKGGGLRDLEELRDQNLSCNTELENWTKRSQKLKVELKDCSSAHEGLLEEEEALGRLLASASEERRQKTSEADRLPAEIQGERRTRKQLEAGMRKVVTVLRHILTQDSEKTLKTQGQRLLEIMESIAPQGPGSTPVESIEPQTDRTDPLFLMARYRPGDLGSAPRPTWNQNPSVCRTRAQPPPNSYSVE